MRRGRGEEAESEDLPVEMYIGFFGPKRDVSHRRATGRQFAACPVRRLWKLDIPPDFDFLKKAGTMIGSVGPVVMDDKTCMVEVARFFMNFTQSESCGRCVPCREGTKRMLEALAVCLYRLLPGAKGLWRAAL